MGDKLAEVLECYELEIKSSTKGRYAQIVETDCGVMQLRPQSGGEGRLKSEYYFKERLYLAGFEEIDRLMHNRDGELATADRYGTMYVLRRYFHGREISVTNVYELDMAVENMARLHQAGRRVWLDMCRSFGGKNGCGQDCEERLPMVRTNYDLPRRNRELKRVRTYISRLGSKSRFEEVYLSVYDRFCTQAENVMGGYSAMSEDGSANHIGYCHGDYNNHNLLVTGKEKRLATVGFDKFYVGNQLADLYYFARKVVEKNGYNFEVLKRIIDGYAKYIDLGSADLEYIYMLFSYPEKFYKLSSQYINGSKVRISPVMLDKLDKIIASEQKKDKILSKYRELYLHI